MRPMLTFLSVVLGFCVEQNFRVKTTALLHLARALAPDVVSAEGWGDLGDR
jgi:hypothetical protein